MDGLSHQFREGRLLGRWSRLRRSWGQGGDLTALVNSASIRLLSIGLNAAQSIFLPMILGASTFGLFAALYTNLTVAINIGRGPVESLVQRGHVRQDQGQAISYRRRGLFLSFLAGLVLAICLFLGLSAIQKWDLSTSLYLFLTIAAFVGAASGLRRGLLISANRTSEVEMLDLVVRPGLFLVAVGICWLLGVVEPLLFWLLGASFLITLAWPNLEAVQTVRTISEGDEPAFRPWAYLMVSNGLSILVKSADVIILGIFLDAATVGRYFIVARIADLAAFGYSFASTRFVHRFADARRRQDWAEVKRLIRRAGGFGLAIAMAAAGAIMAVAPLILPLIDPELTGYLLPLAILLAGQVLNATLGVRGAFLTAIEPRHTLGLKLLLNPLGLVAMALAVPAFGAIGAASVMTLFIFAMQLANTMLLRHVLGKELPAKSQLVGNQA